MTQIPDLRLQYLGGANLYITNLCNGRCPYCCLKDWTTSNSEKATHMKLSDLNKVIDWLSECKIPFVQLIGGEPMMHPEIVEVVQRLKSRNINIKTILSNGLADTDLYKKISNLVNTKWLINVNHPATYSKKDWNLLNENLSVLMWKGKDKLIYDELFDVNSLSLQLAVNFFEPGFDYKYIIDLAKKFKCSHIRYAPSHPSAGKTNVHVTLEELVDLKPTIMNFVYDAVSSGVKPGLECVLPPCVFTTSEWRYLLLFTEALKTICPPDFEIMPDLTVECCVSMIGILPSYKVGSMNARAMLENFLKETRKYRDVMLPMCKDCEIFRNRGCQGYCLRFKYDHANKNWRDFFIKR